MRKDLICIFLAAVEIINPIGSDTDCLEEDCAIWDEERECCSFNTKRRIINLRRD